MSSSEHDPRPLASSESNSLLGYMRQHPVATGTLFLAVLVGASTGHHVFAGSLSPIRSVLGGALAGFGCWLLVMVGRVIGE